MVDAVLSSIYFDPDNPSCFTGAETLYQSAKKQLPELSRKEVKEWLMKQESYSLHAPARKRFLRNPVLVSGIDSLWELDLVDLSKFEEDNNEYKYLLQIIDVGSRFAFSAPLRTKKPSEVAKQFENILKSSGRKPIVCTFDRGKEFTGKAFKKALKRLKIYAFETTSDLKCSLIERYVYI